MSLISFLTYSRCVSCHPQELASQLAEAQAQVQELKARLAYASSHEVSMSQTSHNLAVDVQDLQV